MKKIIVIVIFLFTLMFGLSNIMAEQKTAECSGKKYTFDDSHEGLYCGELPDKIFGLVGGYKGGIILDKNDFKNPTDDDGNSLEVVYYDTGKTWSHIVGEKNVHLKFYTLRNDPVLNQKGKWWSSVYVCLSNTAAKATAAMYTDCLTSKNPIRKNPFDLSHCKTFTAQGMDEDSLLNVCPTLNAKLMELYQNGQSYLDTKNAKYATKYNVAKENLRTLCTQISKFAAYSDACMRTCLDMDSIISNADEMYHTSDPGKCGFSGRLINWIINILSWIKYIIPVVVILFGIIDFIKATGSEKDDAMKKAQANFVKRLIAAALIFLVPLIIEFILPKFGFDYNSCGLF